MDNLDEPRVSRSTAAVVIMGSAILCYSATVGLLYAVAFATGADPAPGDLTAAAGILLVATTINIIAIDMRDGWSRWAGGAMALFALYAALKIVGVM